MATGTENAGHDGRTDTLCASVAFFARRGSPSPAPGTTRCVLGPKKSKQIREPFCHPTYLPATWPFCLTAGGHLMDATIRLWDLAREISIGGQLRTFDGHALLVTDLTISLDGRRVLIGQL